MEEQTRTTKKAKHSRIVALIIAALVVCTAAIGMFLMKEEEADTPVEQGAVIDVKDEKTLRELLLEDSELVLVLSEDIVNLEEGFIVNGKKTLQGNSLIQMKLSAKAGQAVFSVSPNASFVMNGITVDGNCVADGIYVDYDGELEVLGGHIVWGAKNAIHTNALVTIRDVNIDNALHTSIYVDNEGEVYMEGGDVRDSGYVHCYVAKSAYLSISGHSTFDGCTGHGIENYGTMEVKGGTFSNPGWYAIVNYATLTMQGDGTGDERIKVMQTGTGGIYNGADGTTTMVNVEISDIPKNALKSIGGTTTVRDCHIERTGKTAFQLIGCEVKVENVEVIDAGGCGLYAENKANVEIKNLTVVNCGSRGVMSKGADIKGDTITIKKPGTYGITNTKLKKDQGSITVSNVTITDSQRGGIVASAGELIAKNIKILNTKQIAVNCDGGATITLNNATLKGFTNKAEAIKIAKKSTVRMKGNSIVSGVVVRAVGVEGTFIMDGGTICDNDVKYNGAAVYVYKNGSFVMNGGTIRDNVSTGTGAGIQVKEKGKVTIDGGKICNNTSIGNGAGINVNKGGSVYLKSGSITGNKSASSGNGIYANGKVTIGKDFYMGSDEIKLAKDTVVLNIEGNTLSKHSEKEPLLVTPVSSIAEGKKVIQCQTEEDAIALSKVVGSGDGSFYFKQKKQYYTIKFAKADMDMTGADTVYVSDFEALQAAIKGTTSKRYIVLQADIQMESKIKVPGGKTVYIKDDGNARTLSRAEGNGAAFFETNYGTGLYLAGTQNGNLVLNGTASASVATSSLKPLVVAKGSTVIQDVKLCNNGTLADGVKMYGAFVQQLYADITIKDSEFINGKAKAGGAILLEHAKANIENCTFADNQTLNGGGAIRVVLDSTLTLKKSVFKGNESGTDGGAINSNGAKKLVITDCLFTENESGTLGGAINVGGKDSVAFITGSTGSDSARFADNVAKTHGGALHVTTGASIFVDGYEFTNNSTKTHHGGAIFVNTNSNGNVENCTFYENSAATSGGAIATTEAKISVVSCEFGEKDRGNTAKKGGAVYVTGNGEIEMRLAAKGGLYNSLNYNTASESGGAIYVNSGVVTVDGYQLNHNSAVETGGALYIKAKHKAEVKNAVFTGNASDKSSGGAVTAYGTLSVSDTTFSNNTARSNGGAIACYGGTTEAENVVFTENTANNAGAVYLADKANATFSADEENISFIGNRAKNQGGAILVKEDAEINLDGYLFAKNEAVGHGGAVYVDAAEGPLSKATITNCNFTENVTTGSGGAVATNSGTIDVLNTNFVKNEATNGGAVYQTGKGAMITLAVEDGKAALFANNYATAGENRRGGAIRINHGEMILSGYTFENNSVEQMHNNCSTGEGNAIYVAANRKLQISDCTFASNGDVYLQTGAKAYISGNLQAVKFVYQTNGENVIIGNNNGEVLTQDSDVSIQPIYEMDAQVLSAKDAAYDIIKVENDENNQAWYIDTQGLLQCESLSDYYEAKIGETHYRTLEKAVMAAHEDTTSETVEITVLNNVELTITDSVVPLQIRRNIVLKNLPGTDVVITGNLPSPQLIRVYNTEGATCSLEISGTDDGSITIDGTGRTTGASLIRNDAGCTFTLGKNAAVINGGATSSSGKGAGLNNFGTANLYGDFRDNKAATGGAIYNQSTGVVTIYGGTYCGNESTFEPGTGEYGGGGAIYSEGKLTITGATFTDNTAYSRGGAIYHNTTKQLQVDGCTFDRNSTQTNAGGAMYINQVTSSNEVPSYIKGTEFLNNSVGKDTDTETTQAGGSCNGGAIAFEKVTLGITDCQFESNTAWRRGGAIYQNGEGTITITSTDKQQGFVNNAADGYKNGSGAKKAYGGALASVEGTINVNGCILENNKANGKSDDKNSIKYADGGEIIIEGTPEYDARIGKVYYSTLESAVTEAHDDTTSETVEITVLNNVELTMTTDVVPLQIRRNIVLKNLPGKDVVITGNLPSPQLIRVYNTEGLTCSLKISGTDDGSITIDGKGKTTGDSLIRNDAGCTFTLGTNAAVINGGANAEAGGLNNFGTANLYGDFTGNKAANGGAIYNQSTGVVTIYGGTYSGNASTGTEDTNGGGAIYSVGKLTITGAKFTGNTAKYQGGAIYHSAGQLQVEGCTFDGNSTESKEGGAMYVTSVISSDKDPSLIKLTNFLNNKVGIGQGYEGTAKAGGSCRGGAIAFNAVTLDVTDCNFTANAVHRQGGAIFQNGGGTITITSTTEEHSFNGNSAMGYINSSNKAAGNGGALYCDNGTIQVKGYLFENNTADGKGKNYAVTTDKGTVELESCTEK